MYVFNPQFFNVQVKTPERVIHDDVSFHVEVGSKSAQDLKGNSPVAYISKGNFLEQHVLLHSGLFCHYLSNVRG